MTRRAARLAALLAPLLVTLIVSLTAALGVVGEAGAHALLARGDPPINASLRESPSRVTLFMTERLDRGYSSVEVLDSAGQRRDIGATEFSDDVPTQMSVRVLQLEAGVYTVVWRTLSEVDGHTWTGSYVFSVLRPDGSAPEGGGVVVDLDRPGPPVEADAALKAVGLIALFLFVGGVFAALILKSPADRTLLPLIGAAVVVAIGATAYEAISGALRLGGIGQLGDLLWETGNGLWLQQRWYALILAALAILVFRARSGRPPRIASRPLLWALAILGAAWLAATAAISHGAAVGSGWVWAALFDALHLAFAALWIGGLTSVLIVLRRTDLERLDTVRRFSIAAAISVPILAAAGLLSALTQVPNASGLYETDWGIAFIIKGIALAALFSAAAANAFWLRPRDRAADGRDDRLARRFTRLMRVEAALGVAVIAASAALTQLPSPASATPAIEQKDNTVVERVARGDIEASLEVSPNLVGFNTWTAEIAGDDANPVEALLMRFRYEDRSVGPVAVAAERLGDGRFRLEGAYFGLPGVWTIELELRRASGDDLIAAVQTDVESGYQASPFASDTGGALALPLTQMDWNGVGALWALVIGGLAWVNRPQIRDRWGARAGDGAFVGGLLGLIAAVVLLTGLHVEPGRTLANPVERSAESVERGAVLYAANCASCHGETGAGDGPLAGSLPAPPANFSVHVPFHPDGVLFAWISDGIRGTGMPAWSPQLSEQDCWDLVNFLRAEFDPVANR